MIKHNTGVALKLFASILREKGAFHDHNTTYCINCITTTPYSEIVTS